MRRVLHGHVHAHSSPWRAGCARSQIKRPPARREAFEAAVLRCRADQSLQSRRSRPDGFCISRLASLLLSQGQEAIDLNPQLTSWPRSEEQSLGGATGGGGRQPCEQTEPGCHCLFLLVAGLGHVAWPGEGKQQSSSWLQSGRLMAFPEAEGLQLRAAGQPPLALRCYPGRCPWV